MEKIKQDLKKQLITAVILTVSLPLGGVLLGVGLGIGQPGVWAVGIAFMVAGFYGCPIAWAAGYGNTKGLVRVVNAVRDEHLYTVQEISAQLGVNERQVRMKLDACFNKQYLTGFKREGDVIKANFNKDILNRTLRFSHYCRVLFARSSLKKKSPPCGGLFHGSVIFRSFRRRVRESRGLRAPL